jgi:adenine-specific DNA-methyltransferase
VSGSAFQRSFRTEAGSGVGALTARETGPGDDPVRSLERTARMDRPIWMCLAIVERIGAYYRKLRAKVRPQEECQRLIQGGGPESVRDLLLSLEPAWQDHAIACVYAVLLPRAKRRRLGVYFTPPHLVSHLVGRMRRCGLDLASDRIRDPSAGGAAFLVPLAREMISVWASEGRGPAEIVGRLRARLIGREIDPGLASVANALLRRMLKREFGLTSAVVGRLALVRVGDSLRPTKTIEVEHEIGNPPYLRLEARGHKRWKGAFADIASGRLNLYAMFIRRALDEVPPGGLVAYVVPASFLGGPEFGSFRRRILQLAEVLILDVIERRREVFLDAIQDASFLVLRRRARALARPDMSTASSGVLRHDGKFVDQGDATLAADGSPWALPRSSPVVQTATLADYGYRGMVGNLVANREPHRLFKRPARDRLPLVWAKCVTPDGRFDFDRGRTSQKAAGRAFAEVVAGATYAVRVPCVVVQRTSSRNQTRCLTAAPVLLPFLRKHGGIVGENHVIILVPIRPDAVSPEDLSAVLNGRHANAALARVSGSSSISVRLLERIELPPPPTTRRSGRGALGQIVRRELPP